MELPPKPRRVTPVLVTPSTEQINSGSTIFSLSHTSTTPVSPAHFKKPYQPNFRPLTKDSNDEDDEGRGEEEEDPDPINIELEELDNVERRQQIERLVHERNQRQKLNREKKLTTMFNQITQGLPSPKLSPSLFVRPYKQYLTGPPMLVSTIENTEAPVSISTPLEPPVEGVVPASSTDVQKESTTETEKEKEKDFMIESETGKEREQEKEKEKGKKKKEKKEKNEKEKDSKRLPSLVITGLSSRGACLYKEFREVIISWFGRSVVELLEYKGDLAVLFAALIRLAMLLGDYTRFPDTKEAAEARVKYEQGKTITSFLEYTSDKGLRSNFGQWWQQLKKQRLSPAEWLQRRPSKQELKSCPCSSAFFFEDLLPLLLNSPTPFLSSLASLPLSLSSLPLLFEALEVQPPPELTTRPSLLLFLINSLQQSNPLSSPIPTTPLSPSLSASIVATEDLKSSDSISQSNSDERLETETMLIEAYADAPLQFDESEREVMDTELLLKEPVERRLKELCEDNLLLQEKVRVVLQQNRTLTIQNHALQMELLSIRTKYLALSGQMSASTTTTQ